MAEAKKFEYIVEFEPYYMENDKKELCFKSKSIQKLVRCKDCKHNYVTTINHGVQDAPKCDFTDYCLSLNDFCSKGERRT